MPLSTLPPLIMPSPTIVAPTDRGPVVIEGMSLVYKVRSTDCADALGLYELTLAPRRRGAGLHRHAVMTEVFHILEGVLTLTVGVETVSAGPGTVICIPPPVPHAFGNEGDEPVRFMLTFSPALGREGFFDGMAELARTGRRTNRAAITDLMRRYDQEPLGDISEWARQP